MKKLQLKKLIKKLRGIAKNKANKPAALMALAGIILVVGVIFGALNMNGKTKQDAATAQPTAHHKTAQKTAFDQPAATTSPESTNDSAGSTDPTATNTAKKDAKSTAKSFSTATASSPTAPTSSTGKPAVTTPAAPVTDPNATFSIAFTGASSTNAAGHSVYPFTITHEPGHTKSVTVSARTSYGTHDTACVATISGDSGALEMWFTTPPSNGFYVCTVSATDGVTTHTVDLPIDTYH